MVHDKNRGNFSLDGKKMHLDFHQQATFNNSFQDEGTPQRGRAFAEITVLAKMVWSMQVLENISYFDLTTDVFVMRLVATSGYLMHKQSSM